MLALSLCINISSFTHRMSYKCDPGKARVPHTSTSETGSQPKKRHTTAKLKHPYLLKFESREAKLVRTLQKMYELADNDLMMCDCRTGLNDYTINLQFADKLEALAKSLVMMSTQCCEHATDIQQKVSEAQDKKHVANQEIFCLGVMPDIKKCEFVQNRKALHSAAFKSDPDCLPPPLWPKRQCTITISTDEEDEEVYAGDVDTKFMYPRENSIEKERFKCPDCDKHFRDSQELHNHSAHHSIELYRCLKCNAVSRSECSFYNHQQTHTSTMYDCPVEDCGQFFKLKTSLTNHMQKHSEDRMHCSICRKEFQYRQSCLEHEKYRHRKSRTVPCPVCKKLFWMPTLMRSHRSKYHTLVSEMYRDEF